MSRKYVRTKIRLCASFAVHVQHHLIKAWFIFLHLGGQLATAQILRRHFAFLVLGPGNTELIYLYLD